MGMSHDHGHVTCWKSTGGTPGRLGQGRFHSMCFDKFPPKPVRSAD